MAMRNRVNRRFLVVLLQGTTGRHQQPLIGLAAWPAALGLFLFLAATCRGGQYVEPLRKTPSQIVIVGSGITGLCAGALLAREGHQVTVLEMHPELIGGHARTLTVGGLEVSAGAQYVWDFGEGQIGNRVLRRLGLDTQVPFDSLDPNGFDRVIVGNEVLDVPVGLDRFCDVMVARFPDERMQICQFFSSIEAMFESAQFLHDSGLYLEKAPAMILGLALTPTVSTDSKVITMLYSERSLADLFNDCGLSPKARRFLYGNGGIFAEDPSAVSVVAYAAATGYYHTGPMIPRYGFRSLVDGLCDVIRSQGGHVLTGKKVVELVVRRRRVVSVRCADGSSYPSDAVISTISPRLTAWLIPGASTWYLNYQPSNSILGCYLKVANYPLIAQQLAGRNVWWWDPRPGKDNFRDPDMTLRPRMLYLHSPTANGVDGVPGVADSLVIFAPGNFTQAAVAGGAGPAIGSELRDRFLTAVLDALEEEIFPGIRDHIQAVEVLTPWDIHEQLGAELGNVYGRRLNAFNILHANTATPYASNLHLANATIGLPGVAPAFQTANLLVERLVGHPLPSEAPMGEGLQQFGYGLLRDAATAIAGP